MGVGGCVNRVVLKIAALNVGDAIAHKSASNRLRISRLLRDKELLAGILEGAWVHH